MGSDEICKYLLDVGLFYVRVCVYVRCFGIQRSVTHDFLRYINILTYLLTYLLTLSCRTAVDLALV